MQSFLKCAGISVVCFLFCLQGHAANQPLLTTSSLKDHNPNPLFSIEQIINLTPKDYKKITGKKMRFGQKLALKWVQHKIKVKTKKGIPVNLDELNQDIDASDFSFAGFLLGFLLSIFGVLVAYLIGDRRKIKWSWFGFAFGAVIILIILLI